MMRHAISVVLVLAIAGGFGYLGWEVLGTPDVLVVRPAANGAAYRIVGADGGTLHARRGGVLHSTLQYCKFHDYPVHVTAWIEVAAALYQLVPDFQRLPLGCHTAVVAFARVPASLSLESTALAGAGLARLRVRHVYTMNVLRSRSYDFVSDYFWIDD